MADKDYLKPDERNMLTGCRIVGVEHEFDRLVKLTSRLAEARRVLADVEWSYDDVEIAPESCSAIDLCPSCYSDKRTGTHAPDCALAAALEGVDK